MKKYYLLLALSIVVAGARENPFLLPGQKGSESSQPKKEVRKPAAKSVKASKSLEKAIPKKQAAKPTPIKQAAASKAPKPAQPAARKEASVKKAPLEEVRLRFLKLAFYDDRIEIVTSDPLKKDFAIRSPRKIVLDFGAKRAFRSKKIDLATPLFKRVEIGAHKNYYRVAVSLAKSCRYSIKKTPRGYLVLCAQ